MRPSLRPLAEPTLVVTGASSGIGLVTARLAAARGARVVLVSHDAHDLERAVADIRLAGGQALAVVADVADFDAVQRAAERAVAAFGAIDRWVNTAGVNTAGVNNAGVNNAGASLHGSLRHVPLADARRLFETNYWGVVHGSLVAVPHLASRGGALLNVGSAQWDTAMPRQGHDAASQHAVRGFTDALRLEVEAAGLPVAVTLVEPAAIDTPETIAPRLLDHFKLATAFTGQRADEPARGDDTRDAPGPDGDHARGAPGSAVRERSLRTAASLHPMTTALGVAAVGVGAVRVGAALARRLRER